jgi:DUF1365 family protein
MNSRIYEGWVRHRRALPRAHEFRYRIFLMYLDLSELEHVFDKRLLWSAKRAAIAWFKRSDHLGDPTVPLDSEVRALVEREIGWRPSGRITLLTHLRYFGYCMNPVSFYYCWNDADGKLEAIVAEVSNTPWGERHCYVLDARGKTARHLRFAFEKGFHVSPFMAMEQMYAWKFTTPGESLNVHMENYESGTKVFDAAMHLDAVPITGRSLARVLASYPFMTGRIILAIYWQALQLARKRVPFHDHPKRSMPREVRR